MNNKNLPCKDKDFEGSVLCNDCEDENDCPFIGEKEKNNN